MKAKRYSIALLIALIFTAANIQAQSARRPLTQEKKERERSTSTYKKENSSSKAKDVQPSRKVEANQPRSQQVRTVQPARKVEANQPRSQQAFKTNQAKQVNKPVSMSTAKNPRSTYRKPNKVSTADTRYTVPARSNIHHNRAYYGGNHYHYAYPTTKVKIHYHHETYMNHYHVLYYPSYGEIFWTRHMYREYMNWYPGYHWSYSYGHRIQTISIWDAKYNLGEVAMVYGRIYATWYNSETDDYLLLFGGDFPYQQFTAVVPGYIARKFSWRPERFFLGEHVTITGLITTFDGSPEIVIKNRRQLSLY